MRHMEIAWGQEGAGVHELGGPAANKTIIGYFHRIGRVDILSDEVAWCAAFLFWCLMRAGVPINHIPLDQRLLAVSVRKIGKRIFEPRVGAAILMKRPGGHHTGFVVSWTATTIKILGGNQRDSVCAVEFKRTADMEFYWPAYPANDNVAATSRIARAARQQQKDAAKTTIAPAVPAPVLPEAGANVPAAPVPDVAALPDPTAMPSAEALAAKASGLQMALEQGLSFATFLAGRWPWLMLAFAVYWGARMIWNGWRIGKWRAEDAATGKTVSTGTPPTPPQPANDDLLGGLADAEAA